MADTRIERKQKAAKIRREIRLLAKSILGLAQDLSKPKADVNSLTQRIGWLCDSARVAQRELNGILNRGNEVAIIKHAAKAKKFGDSLLEG
jgi:hypothetical protein